MKRLRRLSLQIFFASTFVLSVACGDDDDDAGSDSGNSGASSANSGADETGHSHDDADEGGHEEGNDSSDDPQSECSDVDDCETVVCQCPDGPVNWTFCGVVNGIGRCGTEDDCVDDGACD